MCEVSEKQLSLTESVFFEREIGKVVSISNCSLDQTYSWFHLTYA